MTVLKVPILERATPHECAAAHRASLGHRASESGSNTDCACGRAWHWPVSEEEHVTYLRDITKPHKDFIV